MCACASAAEALPPSCSPATTLEAVSSTCACALGEAESNMCACAPGEAAGVAAAAAGDSTIEPSAVVDPGAEAAVTAPGDAVAAAAASSSAAAAASSSAAAAEARAKMIVLSSGVSAGKAGHGALWAQVDEVLAGREHALMILGNKHLHGIDGVLPSCPLAAAYYRAAADNAIKDMEATDAVQAEFVRLSHEIEKGNAFEGHKGEDDDVFRYQARSTQHATRQAQAARTTQHATRNTHATPNT